MCNLTSFIILKQGINPRRIQSSNANDTYEVEKRLTKRGTNLSDIDIEL